MAIGVLAIVGVGPERIAALAAAGYAVREGKKYPSRVEAVREAGESVRAVLTNGRYGLRGDEMALLPKLEIVCTVGAGYEAVDLDAARSRGIAVANCTGTNASVVADSALMLLMAATRHLRQAERHIRDGGWQEQWRVDTPTLTGKRLGILGLGTIGSRIAQRAARGFDMEIGYHNRKAVAGSPYRYFDSLLELAKWADFLVCSTPGGAGTRHLVNADVLAALGPEGYLVNVGRGSVVDTAALLDALRLKRIAGAGLDVLEGEPAFPPAVPELLGFDNVVLTPHCSGRAPEAHAAATEMVIGNLNAHFAGKPLPSPVLRFKRGTMNHLVSCAAAVIALSLLAAGAQAQSKYPTRPVRLLTPFAAGGGSDILARLIAPHMHEALGQPIVVDNRPGGGGTVGAGIAARADPDGYTLIVVSGSFGANAALHDLPYDSVTGITPILLFGTTPLVLTVHPSLAVKSVREFIDYSRANLQKLNIASAGIGGLDHLAGELFKLQTGATYTVIQYKGSGPAMTALLGAEVSGSMTTLVTSIPHVKAGRLRAIGVTTAGRSRALPVVPAIGETVPGYEVVHWYGLWGPKGLPKDIVTRWNREVAKVLRTSATQKWLEDQGLEPAGGPPEEFANRLRADVDKWKKVVKEARITLGR